MAERLQQVLAQPYALDGTEVTSSASIGITFSSVGYETPGDVLRDADIAMYRAKAAGRARTALFDASLRAQLASQVNLERDLRRALEQQQLSLVFQPIYDLSTGRIDSFEALVRWTHPERGPVPPTTFIPIAEESALIGQLFPAVDCVIHGDGRIGQPAFIHQVVHLLHVGQQRGRRVAGCGPQPKFLQFLEAVNRG